MPAVREQTGYVLFHCSNGPSSFTLYIVLSNAVQNNCDVAATGNAGCGVQVTAPNSYGPAFNNAGGGFYAMERTNSFIKVWFWSRSAGNIPSDILNGATTINTDNWVGV